MSGILSSLIEYGYNHMLVVLMVSWPIVFFVQLLRRRLTWKKLLVSAIGIIGILLSIFWLFASLLTAPYDLGFRLFALISCFVAVFGLTGFESSPFVGNKTYHFWKVPWFITVLIVGTLTWAEYELGKRGPLGVTVKVDEANKEDFVIKSYYYRGQKPLPGEASYAHARIAKAGETVYFPREHVLFPIVLDWLNTPLVITISVAHPEYLSETRKIQMLYRQPKESEVVVVHLTHWDKEFMQAKKSIQNNPDKRLEIRYKKIDDFRYSIGRLNDNWLFAFPKEGIEELAMKYLPWINSIRMEYPEITCKSLVDCEKKIEKGTLGDYVPTSFPFN